MFVPYVWLAYLECCSTSLPSTFMQQKLYYHIKKDTHKSSWALDSSSGQLVSPKPKNLHEMTFQRGMKIISQLRWNGSWTFDFPQTKFWTSFAHRAEMGILSPHPSNPNNSVQACPIRNTSASIVSSGGEVNMAALWAALSGGISADAMSIDWC